jgi:hypothetical protein
MPSPTLATHFDWVLECLDEVGTLCMGHILRLELVLPLSSQGCSVHRRERACGVVQVRECIRTVSSEYQAVEQVMSMMQGSCLCMASWF